MHPTTLRLLADERIHTFRHEAAARCVAAFLRRSRARRPVIGSPEPCREVAAT